jgi:hypothetical protein
LAVFYYLCGKRGLATLEKYSFAAFYYLCSKRGLAALEKYSLAAFYYLYGKRGVAALEKYSLAAFYYLGASEIWPYRKGDYCSREITRAVLLLNDITF